MKYSYSLSLVHPFAKLDSITNLLDISPKRAWEFGAPRQAANGNIMEGLRKETYCLYKLSTKTEETLPEWLSTNEFRLSSIMSQLEHLADTGGTFILIVFVFPEDDEHFALQLDPEHLSLLSSLHLRLGIDLYFN